MKTNVLPQVGEKFHYSRFDYVGVARFVDNGSEFLVAKRVGRDGRVFYSHIFYITQFGELSEHV